MAGVVPAIHVLLAECKKGVDARHKAGHDDCDFINQIGSRAVVAGIVVGRMYAAAVPVRLLRIPFPSFYHARKTISRFFIA